MSDGQWGIEPQCTFLYIKQSFKIETSKHFKKKRRYFDNCAYLLAYLLTYLLYMNKKNKRSLGWHEIIFIHD